MASPTVPLFSLDTLTPPAFITVNGHPYDLKRGDQLTLQQYQVVQRLAPRFDTLIAQESLDDGEAQELAHILMRMCGAVLAAPADVQSSLSDNQRLQVVLAFSALSLLTPGARARATTPPPPVDPSTGASRSPDSAGSTPAPVPAAG